MSNASECDLNASECDLNAPKWTLHASECALNAPEWALNASHCAFDDSEKQSTTRNLGNRDKSNQEQLEIGEIATSATKSNIEKS